MTIRGISSGSGQDSVIVLFVWLVIAGLDTCAMAGKLGAVSAEVRDSSRPVSTSSSHKRSDRRPSSHDDDDDDDSLIGSLLGGLFSAAVEGVVETVVDGNDDSDVYQASFDVEQTYLTPKSEYGVESAPIPDPAIALLNGDVYFDEYPGKQIDGYYFTDDWVDNWVSRTAEKDRQDLDVFEWSARLRTDYLDDSQGVQRAGSRFRFDHRSRFGIDASFDYWWESAAPAEWLTTGDANLMYMFGTGYCSAHRIGVGGNWLHDRSGTEAGVNFAYDCEWIWKHFTLGFELDIGRVGDASTTHYRISTGWQSKRVNLSIGYDYRKFGDVEGIDGLVTAFEFWF